VWVPSTQIPEEHGAIDLERLSESLTKQEAPPPRPMRHTRFSLRPQSSLTPHQARFIVARMSRTARTASPSAANAARFSTPSPKTFAGLSILRFKPLIPWVVRSANTAPAGSTARRSESEWNQNHTRQCAYPDRFRRRRRTLRRPRYRTSTAARLQPRGIRPAHSAPSHLHKFSLILGLITLFPIFRVWSRPPCVDRQTSP
jgi:hypothetical protein